MHAPCMLRTMGGTVSVRVLVLVGFACVAMTLAILRVANRTAGDSDARRNEAALATAEISQRIAGLETAMRDLREVIEHGAAQSAVEDAGKTLRGMRSIYVENFQATITGGKIDKYRVNAKITFEVKGTTQG